MYGALWFVGDGPELEHLRKRGKEGVICGATYNEEYKVVHKISGGGGRRVSRLKIRAERFR